MGPIFKVLTDSHRFKKKKKGKVKIKVKREKDRFI